MTNDEFQMTKETGNPKHEESSLHLPGPIRSFELCHSFDIRPPSAVLPPRPSPVAPVPLRKAETPSAALLRRTGHSDFGIIQSLLMSAATSYE
jgi:hypothetical protein